MEAEKKKIIPFQLSLNVNYIPDNTGNDSQFIEIPATEIAGRCRNLVWKLFNYWLSHFMSFLNIDGGDEEK